MLRPLTSPVKSLHAIRALISATSIFSDENLSQIKVMGVTSSSDDVVSGDLFIALPGQKYHGAQFASQAIERGAVAVLTDIQGAAMISDAVVIVSDNPRRAAGIVSAWLYSEPMRDLYSIGVTGTNGKTTVTTLLHQILSAANRESGLIGSVETRIATEIIGSKRTTPEASELQALCAVMRERHLRNLVMEVSSHAITLERVRGSHFDIVGFTNLSQDHLDFHLTIEDYFLAKASLFTFEYADLAVINIDNLYGSRLAELTQLPVITLSRFNKSAQWYYVSIKSEAEGATIAIRGSGGVLIEGKSSLFGGFNFDNLLMAIAIAVESGIDPIDVARILPMLVSAPGRLDPVRLGQGFIALVDYAHSPDAVTRTLETVRELTKGRVIAVLGCGGDRDSSKRPLMGRALADGADIAIYTSDNPRSERPEDILNQMLSDLDLAPPNEVIVDRASAIKRAIGHAKTGDVVIILGKGHEKGQEIAGIMHTFDDRIELARAIEAKP